MNYWTKHTVRQTLSELKALDDAMDLLESKRRGWHLGCRPAFVLYGPEKPKKTRLPYIFLASLIVVSLGIGLAYLYSGHSERTRHAHARAILHEHLQTNPITESIPVAAIEFDNPAVDTEIPVQEPQAAYPEVSIYYVENKTAPRVPRDEFLALREAFGNEDIVGHLRIEGTAIDYIVVQGSDNDFYLRHDIWQNPSSAGWIFLDYAVDISGQDQNMVLYGHNMRNGTMFHNLRLYVNYSFLRSHPVITFNTIYADYEWEIFAFYIAHINFPYTIINFPNTAAYSYMLEQFLHISLHDVGIMVTSYDRILTLSTCTGANRDERFVLQARLRRGH